MCGVPPSSPSRSSGSFPGIASSNASLLSSLPGAKVAFGVDATRLHNHPVGLGHEAAAAGGGFDVIVFPFPHTGFVPENVHVNKPAHIAVNKQLVAEFFQSAVHQLKQGKMARPCDGVVVGNVILLRCILLVCCRHSAWLRGCTSAAIYHLAASPRFPSFIPPVYLNY